MTLITIPNTVDRKRLLDEESQQMPEALVTQAAFATYVCRERYPMPASWLAYSGFSTSA